VGVLVITTLSVTVTVLGVSPLVTPLFKALVVIAVTLLQSPALRSRLRWRRGPGAPAPHVEQLAVETPAQEVRA
jgi:simple sugar transport system permease protein